MPRTIQADANSSFGQLSIAKCQLFFGIPLSNQKRLLGLFKLFDQLILLIIVSPHCRGRQPQQQRHNDDDFFHGSSYPFMMSSGRHPIRGR